MKLKKMKGVEVSQVDLLQLPAGTEVQVFPEAACPVIQRGPVHAFLCADRQRMRLITMGRGELLFGAATAEELAARLKNFGYKPTIVRRRI